jgi:nitrogen fixation/metabolism regulation signal transduction histidine kinase
MVYRRFTIQLITRLLASGLAMFFLVWMVIHPGYHGLTLIAAVLFVLSVYQLWRCISRSNREIARFLDAARYADFSQHFNLDGMGSGFDELGLTFNEILERLQEQRTRQQTELRQIRALIEHVPVPLLTIHADDAVTLQNNAARRLFGTAHLTRLEDLGQFGSSFQAAVSEAIPGNRELVTFAVEGVEYRLTLATTEIVAGSDRQRLVSLQDIQTELDETQAQAWRELVLVLTHEIMNSITPVTSLARTAEDVVADLARKSGEDSPLAEDIADLGDAIATVARRSDGLMQFVDRYRQITRLAPPRKKRIRLSELLESAGRLAAAEWPDSKQSLEQEVIPEGLDFHVDRDLLEPVLLNLLRNAWQATAETEDPKINIRAKLNHRGRVEIRIQDNGPGVPEEISRKIFVPFFTTKEGGSGVGLALARQVMIAHGGFIRVARNDEGGASFTLTF